MQEEEKSHLLSFLDRVIFLNAPEFLL